MKVGQANSPAKDQRREYTKSKKGSKFNAFVPADKSKEAPSGAAPKLDGSKARYDPRDFLDDEARKRVQDIIRANRERTQEQLKKEGKTGAAAN